MGDVSTLQTVFQNERADRKERETLIAAKIRDLEARTVEKFAQQQEMCDQKYALLHEELLESKRVREDNDKTFQDYIIEEVASLKNGLVVESQTREKADDDIVSALNHYTKALQEALRVVNQA